MRLRNGMEVAASSRVTLLRRPTTNTDQYIRHTAPLALIIGCRGAQELSKKAAAADDECDNHWWLHNKMKRRCFAPCTLLLKHTDADGSLPLCSQF